MKRNLLQQFFFPDKQEQVSADTPVTETEIETNTSQAYGSSVISSPWTAVRTEVYNGEKSPGELGAVVNILPDYNALRLRAYEQQMKSDTVRIITGKFFKWTIGNGLKLQVEPNKTVLKMEGITEDFAEFRKQVEARAQVYFNSKFSDYTGMENLHTRADEAFQTAFLGGDCLAVLRVENGNVNIQVFDGQQICSPLFDDKFINEATNRGNKILSGIEIDKKGTHVAFYVKVEDFENNNLFGKFERIEAKSKSTGRTMAWMVYGSKYRINHHRGVTQLAAILEKVDKLDRYTEATVGGAEERAKIPFFIEHSRYSDGENPLGAKLKMKIGGAATNDPYDQGNLLAKDVSLTTSKTVHNMPIGSKMNAIMSQSEVQYEPFFRAVFMQICAALDIPPEVAMQQYNSNYSASRAAINGWGYIIEIYREKFAQSFYKNFYALWLETEVLKNKISAPGYLKALMNEDFMVIESYNNCRFTGSKMPHIDPKKEADAVRIMLGDETTPLISREKAAELLNQGNWEDNYAQYLEEEKLIPEEEKLEEEPAAGKTTKPKQNENIAKVKK